MTSQQNLEAVKASGGHVIFALIAPNFVTRTCKNIPFSQDLMLSLFTDKNCLKPQYFEELQAEEQTLRTREVSGSSLISRQPVGPGFQFNIILWTSYSSSVILYFEDSLLSFEEPASKIHILSFGMSWAVIINFRKVTNLMTTTRFFFRLIRRKCIIFIKGTFSRSEEPTKYPMPSKLRFSFF